MTSDKPFELIKARKITTKLDGGFTSPSNFCINIDKILYVDVNEKAIYFSDDLRFEMENDEEFNIFYQQKILLRE